MAADGISQEILWSRRIHSDIAAIYGVGKGSNWILLETFDVTRDFPQGIENVPLKSQTVGGLPSSSMLLATRTEDFVPVGARNLESHRIGQHGSHSYVITKFDVGHNPLRLENSDASHLEVSDKMGNPLSLHVAVEHVLDDHAIRKSEKRFVSLKPSLLSMPLLKRIGGLIPFRAGQVESRSQIHLLGQHDSLLFIDNSPHMNNPDTPHSMQLVQGYHPARNRVFSLEPFEISLVDVNPPPSHRTEHGLYLTWSMAAGVIVILLTVIVFFARLIILRQKQKWERMPSLSKTAVSSSNDGNNAVMSTPPQAQSLHVQSSGSVCIWPQKKKPKYPHVTRSFSLGAISTRPPIVIQRESSAQNRGSSTPQDISTPVMSPNTENMKAIPTGGDSADDKSKSGVDNIDGIPLVRYSRYTSEFKEILPLGRGSFGTVFRCRNVLDGCEYAIKKIKIVSPLSTGGNGTKHLSRKLHRVLREVKCLALLDHPNIVRYYTAWLEIDDGVQCEDDETNTMSSIFDRNSLVSGFESFSRAMQQSLLPKRAKYQQPSSGFKDQRNPLGWNNFGSLRLDESKSEASTSFGARLFDASKVISVDYEEDDLGFTWERSKDNSVEPPLTAEQQPLINPQEDGHSSSARSIVNNERGENEKMTSLSCRPGTQAQSATEKSAQLHQTPNDSQCNSKTTVVRHILLIQMQLCSVQTLADFLANHEARGGVVSQLSTEESRYAVDIPLAIRLFAQITHGVKYVHKQGLIHRDLKPQVRSSSSFAHLSVNHYTLLM